MNQYAVYYRDGRDRKHVVAIAASNPQEAVDRLIAFQSQYEGFWCDDLPTVEDVVVIEPAESPDRVQILYHQDYD